MEYSTSVQSENFEPAELKLVLSVVQFLHEIHWFITKEANQLHTNQNWKYWIYGTTLSKLTIKFKVCHDILHPFFRILDLDSRLGGYGTRVINSLFFKLIWKTKGKRFKLKIDPQPDSSFQPKARGATPYGVRWFSSHPIYEYYFWRYKIYSGKSTMQSRKWLQNYSEDTFR